ncbi:integral membrane protein DUF92-domain-containing protein [Collybia nuda]|uniref:Integral membrane protein DUF92-domain-containing protein n=1 Tax=Collybia nuda TaxID=64659 RepID=A0A9P6CLV5_9AGAR|nr:integral membrane protein DUF92-domain-containing protein [Collybia nuda]
MRLPIFPYYAFGLALLLSTHGIRKKSLSLSGGFTAFIVGFGIMAGGLKTFGVSLIVFYLLGSRATKYGKKRKVGYEEGYQEAGYRSGWQVLCNSLSALIAASVWNATYVPGSVQAHILSGLVKPEGRAYTPNGWCVVGDDKWSRGLVFATLGHFACCLGDTLASELGILSKSEPRLITNLKVVPRGTNGGMSVEGTVWSIVGGGVMGTVMGACLLLENKACGVGSLTALVGWGAFAGGFGSLVDSLLGATVQQTRYSGDRHLILQDDTRTNGRDIRVVSGWNILTNNQVNLVSSIITAIVLLASA